MPTEGLESGTVFSIFTPRTVTMSDYKLPGEHVYDGMVFSDKYPVDVLDKVPDFEFRQDDVLIATYPKAGTTWIQQIVWLIMNDVDIKTSREVSLRNRSPFLERTDEMELVTKAKSPRLIKSHLPHQFFKKAINTYKFKTIVGLRNVKDLLVSFYHFYRMNKALGNFDQDFEAFFKLFQEKRLLFGDYISYVLGWWAEKENPNIFFVKYEDLKANPTGEIIKMAFFLGKNLTEAEIEAILSESSFKSMQDNSAVNMDSVTGMNQSVSKFIRKGEVGDWKNYFTQEQIDFVEGRSAELHAAGLEFTDTM